MDARRSRDRVVVEGLNPDATLDSSFIDATPCHCSIWQAWNTHRGVAAETGSLTHRKANPKDQQVITACFAMGIFRANHDNKTKQYEQARLSSSELAGPARMDDSRRKPDPCAFSLKPRTDGRGGVPSNSGHHNPSTASPSDISVVWPQNDYWFGPVCGVDEVEQARNLEAARQLSLSLLYWLQTEAPRPDGGVGYRGLRLRRDVVGGTVDGLAPAPYIRESRRIRAEFTVLEQHIAHPLRPKP